RRVSSVGRYRYRDIEPPPNRISLERRALPRLSPLVLPLLLLMSARLALAAPLGLLDRGGSQVSIESYAPNIVRITISLEKDLALAPPGFGFIASADDTGWTHR